MKEVEEMAETAGPWTTPADSQANRPVPLGLTDLL